MPIDFTSSPVPADGQSRSAPNIAAAFNNIRTTYNAYETANNAAVAAVAAKFTGAAANSALSVAGSGITGKVSSHKVDQLAPGQSATLRTVDITTGYAMDRARKAHAVPAASVTFPINAGGYQWAVIYANGPASGDWAVGYQLGATGGTIETAVMPDGAKEIAYVFMQVSCGLIYAPENYVANPNTGVFADMRGTGAPGNPGGASGTIDSDARAAAVVLNGTSSTFPGGTDINAILGSTATPGSIYGLLKGGATESPLANAMKFYVQPDIHDRLYRVPGSNVVVMRAGVGGTDLDTSDVTVVAYGTYPRVRTIYSQIQSPAAPGTNGVRYLYADLSGTGPAFTLAWSTTANPGTNKVVLRKYWLDSLSGVLQERNSSGSPLGSLASNRVRLFKEEVFHTGNDYAASGLPTTAFSRPANMGTLTFNLAEDSHLLVVSKCEFYFATTGLVETQAGIDAEGFYGAAQYCAYDNEAGGAAGRQVTKTAVDDYVLAGGMHTLTQVVKASAAGVADLYRRSVRLYIMGTRT